MARKSKMKFQKPMPENADAATRAAVYLERANGDKSNAMGEAAAYGDREALEVLNPVAE